MPYESFTDGDYIAGQNTDAGRSGKNNEDDYAVFTTRYAPGDGAVGVLPVTVGIVADGIGGNVAGELASRETIRAMVDTMDGALQMPVGERLVEAVRRANATLIRRADVDPTLQGMGTTVVAAAIVNHTLFAVHVGDSRAYLIRNGTAIPLTVDHSWAQEAIAAGRLSPAEAEAHPNRHVIKRFLGFDEGLEVDRQLRDPATVGPMITQLPLLPGDQILLCSDGLTDVVSDGEIGAIAAKHPPRVAAEKLIQAANRAGGPDNITVVILERSDPNAPRAAAGGRAVRGALIAAALLVIVAGLAWLLATRFISDSVSAPEEEPGVALAEAAAPEPGAPDAEAQDTADPEPEAREAAQPPDDTPMSASAPMTNSVDGGTPLTITVAISPSVSASNGITTSPTITVTQEITPVQGDQPSTMPSPATAAPDAEQAAPTLESQSVGSPQTQYLTTTTGTRIPVVTPAPLEEAVGATPTAEGPVATSTPAPPPTDAPPAIPPTSTPVQNTPTPTVSPTPTATNTPIATPTPDFRNWSVTLLAPMDGSSSSADTEFSWRLEPLQKLPPGFAFEPVFWTRGENAIDHGSGWGGTTTDQSLTIRWDRITAPPDLYFWGVLLVVPKDDVAGTPYERKAYLGGEYTFELKSSGGGEDNSPGCVPPACAEREQ